MNLEVPGAQPVSVKVPIAIDEVDYDPINTSAVYIGNTTRRFSDRNNLTGPDSNTVVASRSARERRAAAVQPGGWIHYLTVPSWACSY